MLSFVCFLRMTHKKLKLNFISAAIQLLIAIWCFLIKTCYYTQRIVFFRSCCTSRNFYFQPNYPIARRRRNHCMVELGGVGVPTYRNRVVIFMFSYGLCMFLNNDSFFGIDFPSQKLNKKFAIAPDLGHFPSFENCDCPRSGEILQI